MLTVAKIAVRTTFGVAALAAAVACGSVGEAGPYDGVGGNFGFVGSGGGGLGYRPDAGGDGSAALARDGGIPGNEAGSSGGSASDGSDGNEIDGDGGGAGNFVDGGASVGVTFNLPPGFFASLDWVISGPSGYYSGTVYFGDAHSIEFVVGGILAGAGYTITMAGTDRYAEPCSGTSAPFDVAPGEVAGAAVLLTCKEPLGDSSEPTDIATGSVGVEAGLILGDH